MLVHPSLPKPWVKPTPTRVPWKDEKHNHLHLYHWRMNEWMNESHNQTARNPTPCLNPGFLFRPFPDPHPLSHFSSYLFFIHRRFVLKTSIWPLLEEKTHTTPRACAHAHLLGFQRWWGCGCRLKVFYKWRMKFGLRGMNDLEYYYQQQHHQGVLDQDYIRLGCPLWTSFLLHKPSIME